MMVCRYRWEYQVAFSCDKSWKHGGEGTRDQCQQAALSFVADGARYGRAVNVRMLTKQETPWEEVALTELLPRKPKASKPWTRRTRSQVLEQQQQATIGCCSQFADMQACDCLETAVPDTGEH